MAKEKRRAKNAVSIPFWPAPANLPTPIAPRAVPIVPRALRRATPTRPPAFANESITIKTKRKNVMHARLVPIAPTTMA